MRILDVSPRVVLPQNSGSRVRTYNLLRHLSLRHEVRQFSYARRGERLSRSASPMQITPSYCEYRYFTSLGIVLTEMGERSWVSAPVLSGAALRLSRPRLLQEWLRWADVTVVEFPWQFDLCRRKNPMGRFVLAAHNVESEKFRSYAEIAGRPWSTAPWVRVIEYLERRAVAAAELILAVCAEDRGTFIDRYGADPARVIVVPNGADTQRYRPADRATRQTVKSMLGLPNKPTVVYMGSDIPPNRAGLRWVRRLAQRTDRFTFLVIGPMATPGVYGNLVATGLVTDLTSYLQASDIGICPIEYGGGTKIKLLESLAAGLPTVAFPEAVHGLSLRDAQHLLVSEKSEDGLLFALNLLADDPAFADRLGRAGRRLVCDHYDWGAIAERLDAALQRLSPPLRSSRTLERTFSGG